MDHHYVYLWDEEFGPGLIKVCGYAPWSGKFCLNSHDWAKEQLRRRGVAFEPLDNGFRSVADPAALAQGCAALGPREIEAFLGRWSARLPLPLLAEDRRMATAIAFR